MQFDAKVDYKEIVKRYNYIIKTVFTLGWIIAVIYVMLLFGCLIKRVIIKNDLVKSISVNDYDAVYEIANRYPSLINENFAVFFTWFLLDTHSYTPLHHACLNHDFEMIKLLMDFGADANKPTNDLVEQYPICNVVAARDWDDSFEAAWYLIERGADVTIEDSKYGSFTFAIVVQPISIEDEAQKQSLELMIYALEQGASLERPQKIDKLVDYGATTVLGLASRNNYALMVEYFLTEDIYDVNTIVDDVNSTALIVAVKGQAYDVCKVLLANGADKTLKDIYGKTALDYAIELENEQTIELLQEP